MTRHDPYAVPPPREPFDYIVDDVPLRRTPVGSPRLLQAAHSTVRLAPDSIFRNWRNEYVTIREEVGAFHGSDPVTLLRVQGAVVLCPRGLGADILDFEATVIDPAGEPVLSVGVGLANRPAVQRKVAQVLDWYRAELALREDGRPPLLTAFEFWTDSRTLRRAS